MVAKIFKDKSVHTLNAYAVCSGCVKWQESTVQSMPDADQCQSKFWHWSQCFGNDWHLKAFRINATIFLFWLALIGIRHWSGESWKYWNSGLSMLSVMKLSIRLFTQVVSWHQGFSEDYPVLQAHCYQGILKTMTLLLPQSISSHHPRIQQYKCNLKRKLKRHSLQFNTGLHRSWPQMGQLMYATSEVPLA